VFQLETGPFEGLQPTDFDAYLESKWASNRFNLERMRARESAQALAHAALPPELLGRLQLGMHASQDHPTVFNHHRVDSQWVFATRQAEARKRIESLIEAEHSLAERFEDLALHHLHGVIGVRLNARGVDLLCTIHRGAALDRRNLAARLGSEEGLAEFIPLLQGMPEGTECILGESAQSTADITPADIPAWTGALDGADWIALRRHFPRDDERLADPDFARLAAEEMRGFSRFHAFASWSDENDHVGVNKQLKKAREARRQAAGNLELGGEVRVIAGLLSGRKGSVVELDGKGSARVRLGTMTMMLPVESLQRV
jgi:hypothetical protein